MEADGQAPGGTEGTTPPRSVLARGLSLLDAFADDAELRLSDLAERTGLPRPTVHRLLAELVSWGGIERTPTGYRLGMTLFKLGQQVPVRRELRAAALPYLQHLYEISHENVHLAVPEGPDTLFLEKLNGPDSMQILGTVGSKLPAYCTATGKIFLASRPPASIARMLRSPLRPLTPRTIVAPRLLREELARTAARGYGINVGESEDCVVAVAAPIVSDTGEVVAAISVTGYSQRLDLRRLTPIVRRAGHALSRQLGYRPTGRAGD